MSIENKIVITSTSGKVYRGTSDCYEENYLKASIDRIRDEIAEFDRFSQDDFIYMWDMGYHTIESILKSLTPNHVRMIELCFSLYQSREESSFEWLVASKLYEIDEHIAYIKITREDSISEEEGISEEDGG